MILRRSKAQSKLAELGLFVPDKPVEQAPTLPRDITEVAESVLMDTWAELTAWADYTAAQAAIAYAEEKSLLKNIERLEQLALLSNEKVTKARAEVRSSEDMERMVTRWLEAEAFRKLLEVLLTNFERDAALLSRELSRRLGESKGSRRDRWQT